MGPASNPPGVSVVVPVYNGAATIPALVARLEAALAATGDPFEIILVNDGSGDGSWAAIEIETARSPRVTGIDLSRNFGQHPALLCGIRAARFDRIVTLDDDLQHPPEEIPLLLAALGPGVDVVYGAPIDAVRARGLGRTLASGAAKVVLQDAMGAENARNISAFRALRAPVRDAFASYGGPDVNLDVLLTWGTTRFASVPVRHDPRAAGPSRYTLPKLVAHLLAMVTGFSLLPLRIAMVLGLAVSAFGVLVLVYVIVSYLLRGTPVAGFPFLACIIAIFSGAQLLALGAIGEYLARIHLRTMDRPAYVVRDHAGEDAR